MQEIAAAGRVLLTRSSASALGYGIEALAMISAFPPDKQDWALEGKRTIKELREVRKQLSPKKEEVVDHISHPDDMWWECFIGSTIELIDLVLELPSYKHLAQEVELHTGQSRLLELSLRISEVLNPDMLDFLAKHVATTSAVNTADDIITISAINV